MLKLTSLVATAVLSIHLSASALAGDVQVIVYDHKAELVQAAGGVLRQIDLEDLQPGAFAQVSSRAVEIYAFVQPFAAIFVNADESVHGQHFGPFGTAPTWISAATGLGMRLPQPVSAVGFHLKSEFCPADPAPIGWRLLDDNGAELVAGELLPDEGCPGTPQLTYVGLRASVSFHAVEFHRVGPGLFVDDLALEAADVITVPAALTLEGERVGVHFDELAAPMAAPFASAGIDFSGFAEVWDQLFGLTHEQAFQGQGSPPNFLLTNLGARMQGSFTADGLAVLALPVCGGLSAVNLTTLNAKGGQVDYFAVSAPGGLPHSLQLSGLRKFEGLSLTGAEPAGGGICNLALDDLALVRTSLHADDFEDVWPVAARVRFRTSR